MGSNNAKPKSALQKFQAGVFSSNSSNEIQVGDGRVDGFAKLTEKPDNLVYLFGEDQDGMKIVSFDPIKYELKRKRLPHNFDIKNYPGCIQLSYNKICLAGGINKDLNRITNKFYIYNPITDTVIEKKEMGQIRYTFPLVSYRSKLYAIGGRIYGGDEVSL